MQLNASDLKFVVSTGIVAGTIMGLQSAKQFAPKNVTKQTMDTLQKIVETTTCVSLSLVCGATIGCLVYTQFLAKERKNCYADFRPH